MKNFEYTMNSFNNIIEDYNNIMKSTKKKLADNLNTAFKSFFDDHPEVNTIHWLQYTPYFNDGEECIFGVHEVYFDTEYPEHLDNSAAWGESETCIVDRRWNTKENKYTDTDINPRLIKDMRSLNNILQSDIMEDVLKMTYDNHVWVLIGRNGVDIREWDHD